MPIGLAIEDEALRSVNLLPAELRNLGRKRPNLLNVALPVAAVVPFIAVGVMFLNASGDVTDRQGQLDTVQAQIAALPEPMRPDIDPTLELAEQQRGASLAAVLGTRLAWDRVLVDLSRVLPANVWLTHFTAQAPAYAADRTGRCGTAGRAGHTRWHSSTDRCRHRGAHVQPS